MKNKQININFDNFSKKPYFWVCLAFILLSPILLFPISADLSIYIMGGESILKGQKLYTDFIDIKPPAFYYIFAGIISIFGRSEFGVRFFDLLLQTLTSYLIFKICYKTTNKKIFAGLSSILYAILYTTMGYSQTLQGESLITPLVMTILYLQLSSSKSIFNYIFSGILIGISIGIKYPFGIMFLFIIFDDITSKKLIFKEFIKKEFIIGFTALLIFLISLISLCDKTVFQGFILISDLVQKYSSRPAINSEYIVFSLNKIAIFLGDNISFLVSGSVFVAIFIILSNKIDKIQERILLNKVLLFAIFFIISIFIERKFHEYYFVRMMPLWTILAVYSLHLLIDSIKSQWKFFELITKFSLIFIVALSLYFSPLLRYVFRAKTAVVYLVDRDKFNFESEKYSLATYRPQWIEVSNFLNKELKFWAKKPFLLNIQTGAAPINYFTPKFKHSAFQQSQFYFSIESPGKWKREFFRELQKADYLCIENDDIHPTITGHNLSSNSFIFEQKENIFAIRIKNYINCEYKSIFKNKNFEVFRRK